MCVCVCLPALVRQSDLNASVTEKACTNIQTNPAACSYPPGTIDGTKDAAVICMSEIMAVGQRVPIVVCVRAVGVLFSSIAL